MAPALVLGGSAVSKLRCVALNELPPPPMQYIHVVQPAVMQQLIAHATGSSRVKGSETGVTTSPNGSFVISPSEVETGQSSGVPPSQSPLPAEKGLGSALAARVAL